MYRLPDKLITGCIFDDPLADICSMRYYCTGQIDGQYKSFTLIPAEITGMRKWEIILSYLPKWSAGMRGTIVPLYNSFWDFLECMLLHIICRELTQKIKNSAKIAQIKFSFLMGVNHNWWQLKSKGVGCKNIICKHGRSRFVQLWLRDQAEVVKMDFGFVTL